MPHFIKMNGEVSVTGKDAATGQIFILDQNCSGGLAEIKACYYDGTAITLKENALQKAEITTRDIDRGDYPHFSSRKFPNRLFPSREPCGANTASQPRIILCRKSFSI